MFGVQGPSEQVDAEAASYFSLALIVLGISPPPLPTPPTLFLHMPGPDPDKAVRGRVHVRDEPSLDV